MKIIINGIGVAGPTLAWWLARWGHSVVLVEQAPALRTDGYIIDFWGVGYDIAERMGVIDEILHLGYQVQEVRFVDGHGRKRGGFDVDVFGRMTNHRFTSVRRSDVSGVIYRAIAGDVETLFGDSVAGIEERGDGVDVTFDHAPPRRADLVIGTDGLHSRVRRLVFGDRAGVEVPLGYHVGAFEAVGYRPRDELVYISHAFPGRQISRFTMRDNRTLFLLVFRDEYLRGDDPRSIMHHAFDGTGWEWPEIARELDRSDSFYFDSVSQIRMPQWCKGRSALVGDAGACVSLMAGEGTGLAIAEAYVLAGELHAAGGDFATAFARYQERLMPFLARKQRSAAKFAATFAPRTAFGNAFRNAATKLMRIPFVAEYFVGRDIRDSIDLPDYDTGR